ncbi:EB1 homolog, putative [Plasmodium vivax]|uniref:EB1 homolog, putative n=1 Tax=Plasmodium vivax TaxID=5855 RepID=A0A1G4GWZ5_PLAVI|nr:EB1 homolog, putative [Plasmodium vivax]
MSEGREASSLGMMDSAFFVSRKELIEWVNRTLKLNVTKIEQCSNGAIYTQLLDILFPNKSVLHKVKWNAKLEYECIINYKLIQNVFNKLGIKKHMDIDKLIRGKYQDNLEFLQWFKAFFERIIDYNNENVINYDPLERRKMCVLGDRGDYKLLNSYLPDWAKVDMHNGKEKVRHNENRACSNGSKRNNDFRSSVNQDNVTCSVATRAATTSSNNSSAANLCQPHAGRKIMKTEKRSAWLSTAGDNNVGLLSCKEVHDSKRHPSGASHQGATHQGASHQGATHQGASHQGATHQGMTHLGNHLPATTSTNKRLSVSAKLSASAKLSSRGSLSSSTYYHPSKNNPHVENHKDALSLNEQNRKFKIQLEKKNSEIVSLQDKLKAQEKEKKLLLFQKNFYYNKLRFLELLCNQTDDDSLLVSDIQHIIYARENTYFHQTISLGGKASGDGVEPSEVAPSEADPNEVDPNEVYPNEVDPNEVYPNEVDPNEVYPNEVDPNEVYQNEVDAAHSGKATHSGDAYAETDNEAPLPHAHDRYNAHDFPEQTDSIHNGEVEQYGGQYNNQGSMDFPAYCS